jgi:thiol-disulfide isomerase/thioredoxin
MKRICLIIVVACLLFSCANEKTFKISGTITDFGNPEEPTMLYLKTRTISEELVCLDSTYLSKEGKFVLQGKSSETDLYFLADMDNVFFIRVFVEPGNRITVSGSAINFTSVKIKGSKTQALYESYLALLVPVQEKQEQIRQDYYTYSQDMSISEEGFQKIEEELIAAFEQLEGDVKSITFDFINANSNNIVGAYLVYRNTSTSSNSGEVEAQLQWLNPAMSNKFVTQLKERIEKMKLIEIGALLPNIELPDTKDHFISLESLRGKYVLVDFWASWCGPCLKEVPNLKKAYSAYHAKGFEIYSISLDNNKIAWLDGIEKHELNWLHVSDLLAFDSPVAKLLAVNYIPRTFLLDANGVIIAVNVREDALINKLSEVLQ